MKRTTAAVIVTSTLALAVGCIHVTTESEIKPIHITMDVNVKVDKELDRQFADERQGRASGDFKAVKALLDRKVAGVDNRAMLVAREGATDADRNFITEANARRLGRFKAVAKDNGSTVEAVQKRHVVRMRERFSAGVWYQDDAGAWKQK